MSNKLRKARRKRSDGPKFVQLFPYLLDCPAFASLSLAARAALTETNRGYNGSNNGKIILGERQLAERMDCTRKTARKAVHELIEKGFVEPRIKGAFSVKFRRATEWRLNDRRCDATGVEQSQAFLKWQNPTPNDQSKSISRGQNLPLYGGKNYPTGNFGETPARGQILPHYRKIHGGKNYPTSISTRATGPDAAPEHAPIGHNAGPPLEPDTEFEHRRDLVRAILAEGDQEEADEAPLLRRGASQREVRLQRQFD